MKKFFTISFITLLSLSSRAQSSDHMSYQAVVRNAENELVSQQEISVKINILQGSASGSTVYSETHSPSTNINGLMTLFIGNGEATTGSFASIDWSNGPYFVQTDIDPEGGSDFSITAISQLLSVPYALYAKTAESYSETDPVFSSSVAAAITAADTTKWASGNQLTEEEIIAYVANNGYLTEEIDGDSTNEIQDLSLTDNSLTITNNTSATSIDLSKYASDTTLTEAEVDTYVANNGYLTEEIDGDSTNEIQNIALNGSILSISDGNSVDLSSAISSSYSIGDQLHGGIVFYVDETGQHGLVCAIEDQASNIAWSFSSGITGGQFFGVGGGYMNTMLIVASQLGDYPYSNASSSYAAYFCAFYYTTVDGTQIGGWYLPNIKELRLMADAKDEIDAASTLLGGTALSTDPYWTSQEGGIDTNSYAQAFDMSYTQYGKAKTETLAVRAIKRF